METLTRTYGHVPIIVTTGPNDLTIITVDRPGSEAVASLVLPFGSLDDGEQHELQHLIEHVVHSGPADSTFHPRLAQLCRRGVTTNAHTTDWYTEYWLRGAAEDVQSMVQALCMIVFDAEMDSTRIEREQTTIARELYHRMYDRATTRIGRRFLYPHHAAVQIAEDDAAHEALACFTDADLLQRYRATHVPQHAALIVVGNDVVHSAMVHAVASCAFPRSATSPPRPVRPTYDFSSVRASAAVPGYPPNITCYFNAPRPATEDTACAALVAIELLTLAPIGTLFQALREQDGILYSIGGDYTRYPFTRTHIGATARPEHHATIEERILEHCAQLAGGTINAEAFDIIRSRFVLHHRTPLWERSNGIWTNLLRDRWLEGTLMTDVNLTEQYERLTHDDVARVAATYLTRNHYACLCMVPADEAL